MTLFRDIFCFLRREKVWTLLFIFLVLVYFLVSSQTSKRHHPPRESVGLQKLRTAEIKLKEEIQATGGLKQFLSSKPGLSFGFSVFTGLIVTILLVGLIVNFGWALKPEWRARLPSGAGPPEAPSWGIGTIFKVILLFVLGTMSLSFLLALAKNVLFHSADPHFLVLLHTTLSDLLCIGVVMARVHKTGGHWKDLGFRRVRPVKDVLVGAAGYAAILPYFFLVLFFLVWLVQLFSYEPPPHPLVEIFVEGARSPGLIAYSLFLACVAGPFFEEIFFRGFCYPAFRKRWGTGWALVLTAAFFSVIHQNLFAFFPVFILGLGLGYLYEKRGSLLASIALHVLHNTIFITYFFLAKEVLMKTG